MTTLCCTAGVKRDWQHYTEAFLQAVAELGRDHAFCGLAL